MWQLDFQNQFGLKPSQIKALERYLEMLTSARGRNLTAVNEPAAIIDVHFRDSLGLLEIPETAGANRAVDIGSGAGIPGLPLAIARPRLQILMLESVSKKYEFIKHAIDSLGLENASAMNLRAEEAGHTDLRQSFDLAFARAVGSLSEVLEYSLPLLKTGGFALLQRGAYNQNDVERATRTAEILGGSLSRIESVRPYPGARNLSVWLFSKHSPTPERYPRRPGIPRKRPL